MLGQPWTDTQKTISHKTSVSGKGWGGAGISPTPKTVHPRRGAMLGLLESKELVKQLLLP